MVALVAWLRRPKVVWSMVTEQLECGSVHVAAAGPPPAQGSLDIAPTDDAEKAGADLDRWECRPPPAAYQRPARAALDCNPPYAVLHPINMAGRGTVSHGRLAARARRLRTRPS